MVGELLDQAAHFGGTHVVPSFLTLGALLLTAAFVIRFRGTRWTLRHAEAPRAQPAAVVAPDDDRALRLLTIAGLASSGPPVDREQPTPAAEGRGSSRPGLAPFLSMIPGVPITLFALDRAGSFTFVDGHGFAPLGWRPAELLEWTPAQIVERLPGLTETVPRVLAGESGTMTWVVQGEVFDVHYAPLVGANADTTGMTGVAINVTERVKQEEQSHQQTDELHAAYEALQQTQVQALRQERLYAVGTMANGIVHHLNNSLTTVLGYTEMLLERSQLWEDRDIREKYLRLIQKGGKDTVRVLARLRDFYRPVQGGEPLVAVDLVDAVEQAIDLARPRWHDQAALHGQVIEIVKDLSPVPPIEGNPAELRDALANLVFNAVEAIPATGTIAIQTRRLDDRVILEVADTGIGMTEDVRLHCFDPFFTTKKDRGIGLGLATVYGVVRRYRGTIDVESAPGRGTTFTIGFPACSAAPSSPSPLASDHAPRRILLIDDDAAVRDLVGLYLRSDGHVVVPGADGPDGLAHFQAERFDLVIVDRSAAGVGGDRIALLIKERSLATPVLMLTGYGDLMEAQSERPPGVDLVVSKPITPDGLRAAVAALTGGRDTAQHVSAA